ncbi:MAG: tetratricopeptide repeat protein, partial [Terriglobia bacterium]
MSIFQPDKAASREALLQYIRELENLCGARVKEQALYLSLLLKELSVHSPDKALAMVQTIEAALDSSALRPLLIDLGKRFLSNQAFGQLDILVGYADERRIALETSMLIRMARYYTQTGQLAKAKRLSERARSNDPQSPFPIQELYTYAVQRGDISEAHSLLNSLVRINPSPATYAYAFKERAKLMGETGKPVRIALLSSFTIDQLAFYLDVESRLAGLNSVFYVGPFNQYTQDILNPESELYRFDPEIVFLFLALEDLFPEINACPSRESLDAAAQRIQDQVLRLTAEIRGRSSALVVVAEFVLLHPSPHGILDSRLPQGIRIWTQTLNHQIAAALQAADRSYVLPLHDVVSIVGQQQAANPKLYYMASMKIGEACFLELARYGMR